MRTFFDGDQDAFNRLDGHAESAHYHVPATIVHTSGNGVFCDHNARLANNEALCAQYAVDGLVGANRDAHRSNV